MAKKTIEKRMISVEIPQKEVYISMDHVEDSIANVIHELHRVESQALALGYTDIGLSFYTPSYEDGAGETTITVIGTREETDVEFEDRKNRLEANEKRKALLKSDEYQKYLELKKKFG